MIEKNNVFNPNEHTQSCPTIIRKLSDNDCGFVRTVFNSNFKRLIDPAHYHYSSLFFEKKKNNELDSLTDLFWFEANRDCSATYDRLPMVYPFIETVQKHIDNKIEGIELISRTHPFEKETGISLTPRKTYVAFNEFLDFLAAVNVLETLPPTNGPTQYKMVGYFRFKIIRG